MAVAFSGRIAARWSSALFPDKDSSYLISVNHLLSPRCNSPRALDEFTDGVARAVPEAIGGAPTVVVLYAVHEQSLPFIDRSETAVIPEMCFSVKLEVTLEAVSLATVAAAVAFLYPPEKPLPLDLPANHLPSSHLIAVTTVGLDEIYFKFVSTVFSESRVA